ncbi:NHLP bacteriocin export ABC transporter permease/ATPase subunit [Nodosilinea sp. LEGE 06152]|uniref:NHLP bacteriocin export ABC transporter permease/ATPase subunit n=1 Tax=Nodosilinea sp. LEGE 06152 TaxID=2777966 RepID=UPI00187E5DD8|nr:NHLP bacteriocin export ABC transporter permease/ATPase subunit [Nodosilinea sp. LEGE 06152]MBE9157939.1 NHLP bacteriocin export ABC transporter permease/ATPase subunit [Nodosilinea sp. LEGE 06152]
MLTTHHPLPFPPHALRSNEPFFLDDPKTCWRVEAGTLALFAVSVQALTSRRRYLFSVKPGAMLFPVALLEQETPCQLMAMPLESVSLRPIALTALADELANSQTAATNLEALENWVHRLGAALSDTVSARLATPIETSGLLSPGEVYQPSQGRITWVRLLAGEGQLLGLEHLTLTPAVGPIPLSSHLWLQATAMVELEIWQPQGRAEPVLAGLGHLQTLVLRGIQHLEAQQQVQEYQRFEARARLNTQAVSQTLTQLAGVFEPAAAVQDSQGQQPSEDALLVAAGAVGRALGIAIQPPAQSEDLRRVRDPLEAIARASQIRTRQVALRDDWWRRDGGPLLAYAREDGRPLALLPVGATRYEVVDPQRGTRVPCSRAVAEGILPTAHTFYRPLPYQLKPVQLLQFALQGHRQELLVVAIASIAATLLGMVTPQATGILIDQAIPNADQTLLLQIAFALLATTFGATLFQLTQGIALMRIESFADSSTQAAVWDRLLKLKTSFFRGYSIGDLSARVSSISQIRQRLGNTLLKSLFSSLFSLLNLGLLFYYSVPLALIAAGVALLNMAVTVVSGVLTLKKIRPLHDQQGKLFGMMVQMINGVAKFRVAGAETRAFAYWGRQYGQELRLTLASEGIEDNLTVINNLLAALTPAVLFAFATGMIQQSQAGDGSFSTGTFLAFNAAFGTFIGGATSLSSTVIDVLDVLPIWQRAEPILAAQPEVDPSKADPGRISGQVTVSNVGFRYRSDGDLILDGVTLAIEPGEFVALVGPSGSGKSTLFRLLLGFDAPEVGTVYFDGQDMAGLDLNALRRQFGVVLQTSRLMSASIFENIASSARITMEEAWEAASMAGLADDILSMPMGMHTVVSEGGTNLSGGQRQRLLIARALALRPRILLFDEATSALDNRTQAIVSESLERLRVTRIVVAHRLSTIRNADRIYVLEKGRLVQQGSFDQLATAEGLFSQLVKRQQV